jgi:hypothetical protein
MNNKLLLVAFVVLAITVLVLLTKRREHLDEVTCAKRVANVSQQLRDVEQKVQDGKDQFNKSQGALAMAS